MSEARVGINKRVADRLYDEGVIDESDYVRAVDYAKRKAVRVEEALIELDITPEKTLLKFIATMHKTQFVSSVRMSKAKIDEQALKLVPRGMAMHYLIYPLVLDRMNEKIIVATPDPDNAAALKELALAAKVERVVAMVARPEAVVAAIERGYQNDRTRFKKLLQARVAEFEDMLLNEAQKRGRMGQPPPATWADERGPDGPGGERRQRSTGRPITGEFDPPAPRTGDAGSPRPRERMRSRDTGRGMPPDDGRYGRRLPTGRHQERRPTARPDYDYEGPPGPAPRRRPYEEEMRAPVGRRPPTGDYGYDDYEDDRPSYGDLRRDSYAEPPRRDSYAAEPDFPVGRPPSGAYAEPSPYPASPSPRPGPAWDERRGPPAPVPDDAPKPRRPSASLWPRKAGLSSSISRAVDVPKNDTGTVFGSAAFLELMRVLVGLLENERADLRGHSAFVARLSQSICDRISLTPEHATDVIVASYLHDLGRMGSLHLTALNVAQSVDHLELASKVVKLPQQLTESVGLPERVIAILDALFERQGGGGIPEGISGKDIPIGARIIAVADSYADLTRNPSNEYGRMLSPDEALDVLSQQGGSVFDMNLIDVLEKTTGGEKILTDLLADRHRVLIADPDPEETMVLQLRLAEQGFDVHVARTVDEASRALRAREFALVVSEIDLDEPGGGFGLKENAANQKNVSWVFLSSRDDRDTAARALKLGVDDFIAKPVSTEILVAKLMQLVERQSQRVAPRGVSGSLAQMGIPEIVQILWHGRKTCALNITQGDRRGQIHFEEGRIVNALWEDVSGETAFYRLIALGENGDFSVDPEFAPTGDPVIHASPEGLLLEGMRLLDEGLIP
ncbi:MAG: DUF4388 domain-containing protein [Myxococcales bacterium]|nr:DUF4388 domain-containing protein [Myxococcales bacterium]